MASYEKSRRQTVEEFIFLANWNKIRRPFASTVKYMYILGQQDDIVQNFHTCIRLIRDDLLLHAVLFSSVS